MLKQRDIINPMTQIDFNRNSSGGYPPCGPRVPGASAAPSGPNSEPGLLSRVVDCCARLGRSGRILPETLRVEGVSVLASGRYGVGGEGSLLAWGADLGWREGRAVAALKAAGGLRSEAEAVEAG